MSDLLTTDLRDPFAVFREFLLTSPSIRSTAAQRVAAATLPTAGYSPQPDNDNPNAGPAIFFNSRGGGSDDTGVVSIYQMQIQCYAASGAEAMALANKVRQHLARSTKRNLVYEASEDTKPQIVTDSGTDWVYVLLFWSVHIKGA